MDCRNPLINPSVKSPAYGVYISDATPSGTSRNGNEVRVTGSNTHTTGNDLQSTRDGLKSFDVSIQLLADRNSDHEIILTPMEAATLKRKIDKRLLPLIFLIVLLQFIDKSTLAASSILGIKEDAHLTTAQYNNIGSAFFVGHLTFQYPQNWALQVFPVAKWLSFNIFMWAVLLGLHALCSDYRGLLVARFFLGACEGAISAGVMIISSMYWTQAEIGERIGWVVQCNGWGLIIVGFLSFGLQYISLAEIDPFSLKPWRWLMITTAFVTCISAIIFYILFPDNPTSARFLTPEEKIQVVTRIQSNRSGIETKVWKKYQFVEALLDPKSWLFFSLAFISNLQSSIGIQYNIIIKELGFSSLQTTLLGIPYGLAAIFSIAVGNAFLRRWPNARSSIAVGSFALAACFAIIMLSFRHENKVGRLCTFYFIGLSTSGYAMVWGWATSTVAGHTKKITTSGMFLIGYALGQIISPQFWKDQYKPNNLIPWSIIIGSYLTDITLILVIRQYLSRENNRRDSIANYDEYVDVDLTDSQGNLVRRRVDKSFLDLTDRENLSFRYVL